MKLEGSIHALPLLYSPKCSCPKSSCSPPCGGSPLLFLSSSCSPCRQGPRAWRSPAPSPGTSCMNCLRRRCPVPGPGHCTLDMLFTLCPAKPMMGPLSSGPEDNEESPRGTCGGYMRKGQRMVTFGSPGAKPGGLEHQDICMHREQRRVLTIQPPPSVVMSQYTCSFWLSSPWRKMV